MVNEFAEDLKARGNEAYAAKRFEDAIVFYDRAIEADATNFVYYNNRAAAHHELRNYSRAIEDARQSIALEDNAKAHIRLGAALWAQLKYREAKEEFLVAEKMDPSKKSTKDSIELLEKLINPLPSASGFAHRRGVPHPYEYARAAAAANAAVETFGGEFVSAETGLIGLVVDVAVIVFAALQIVTSMFMPSMARTIWTYLLLITMGQQALVMRVRGLLQFKKEVMNTWMTHFSSLLFVLCFFAQLTGVQPILFIPVFLTAYSVLDLVNKRLQVAALVGPLYGLIAPYMQRAQEAKDAILLFTAGVEAMLLLVVIFTGGTFFTLVYIQYIKNRYNHDGYMRLAFKGLRMNMTRLTTSSFMPKVVDKYAQKFFDFLNVVANQSV